LPAEVTTNNVLASNFISIISVTKFKFLHVWQNQQCVQVLEKPVLEVRNPRRDFFTELMVKYAG